MRSDVFTCGGHLVVPRTPPHPPRRHLCLQDSACLFWKLYSASYDGTDVGLSFLSSRPLTEKREGLISRSCEPWFSRQRLVYCLFCCQLYLLTKLLREYHFSRIFNYKIFILDCNSGSTLRLHCQCRLQSFPLGTVFKTKRSKF